MNKTNDGGKYGFTQYRFPHNYDLDGCMFTLFSSEDSLNIEFISKTIVSINGTKYTYENMKIEKDIYFVLAGNLVFVLDNAEKNALLIKGNEYIFYSETKEKNTWSLTDNMAGTGVKWVFGFNRYVNHIYYNDKCKVQWVGVGNEFEEYASKFIYLRDGFYLVDITAPIPEKNGLPKESYRIIMLQDYERVVFTGCVFGREETAAVSGYGKFPDFHVN